MHKLFDELPEQTDEVQLLQTILRSANDIDFEVATKNDANSCSRNIYLFIFSWNVLFSHLHSP